MNATHLIRVEGVNLANFVFDTRDLSTARGGSLMLLEAVHTATSAFEGKIGEAKVRVLSRGASSGLFEIETADAATVTSAVRKALAAEFPHATFVVDVVAKSGVFQTDIETLYAANRWRQMQAASLAVPPANVAGVMDQPACALDGVRPAVRHSNNGAPNRGRNKESFISDAALARRVYGQDAKQTFYGRIIKRVAERGTDKKRQEELNDLARELPAFAKDFEAIAKQNRSRLENNNRLPGKLAIFYADGNSFGKKQVRHCTDPDRQIAFDEFLRSRREAFLTNFLLAEANKSEWRTTVREESADVEVIRFETLLWGGDEVMFVMPAALGWRFATLFFEQLGGCGLNLNQARLADGTLLAADEPLTHTAALVFCQHHAPIHRIKRLAKDQMAESSKGLMAVVNGKQVELGRSRDQLVVVALESFDHLGNSYEEAMRRRYSEAIEPGHLVLPSSPARALHEVLANISAAVNHLRSNQSEFARSQLRGLVNHALAQARKADSQTPPQLPTAAAAMVCDLDQALKGFFKNANDEDERQLKYVLKPCFPSDTALWLQLEELWDYALP